MIAIILRLKHGWLTKMDAGAALHLVVGSRFGPRSSGGAVIVLDGKPCGSRLQLARSSRRGGGGGGGGGGGAIRQHLRKSWTFAQAAAAPPAIIG